jgi:hypothetical protein
MEFVKCLHSKMIYCRDSVVCPRGHSMAAWELELTATAQSYKSIGAYTIRPAKVPNSKFKIWFLLTACLFCTTVKLKNHK